MKMHTGYISMCRAALIPNLILNLSTKYCCLTDTDINTWKHYYRVCSHNLLFIYPDKTGAWLILYKQRNWYLYNRLT